MTSLAFFFFFFAFDPGRGSTTTFNIDSIAPSIPIATNPQTTSPFLLSQNLSQNLS